MLEFSVSNQLLTRLDNTAVFSDSQNYLECAFTFSDDWAGLTAVASFGHAQVEEPISVRIVDGKCRVPWEVIEPYGFQLSVYGSGETEGEEGFTHVPTNVVTVEVGAAGVAVGLSAPEPTPGLYDTLLSELKKSEQATLAAKGQAVTAAGQAQTARNEAVAAQETVAEQTADCRAKAQIAAQSAQSAQRSENYAQRAEEKISARQSSIDRNTERAVYAQMDSESFAVGLLPGRVVAAPEWGLLMPGAKHWDGYLELVSDQRYMAEIDGVVYRARATRVVSAEELGGLVPQAANNDEEFVSSPDGEEFVPSAGDDEEFVPPIGGGNEPDIPVILDPIDMGKYQNVVKLKLGPVTIRDGLFTEQESPEELGESLWETSGQTVEHMILYTDGMDNARFYMQKAQQAAREAQAALAAIQAARSGT